MIRYKGAERIGYVVSKLNRFLVLFGTLSVLFLSGCHRNSNSPLTSLSAPPDPWNEAIHKIEEDRGEPTGRQAKVVVPSQLKLYSDSRRFLSTQVAESRKYNLTVPHDFADLIVLIKKGELVEVPALGKNYLLYAVGNNATEEPFTHYDTNLRKSVPIYANDAQLQQEYDRISSSESGLKNANSQLKEELKHVGRRDKERRKELNSELAKNEQATVAINENRKLLDTYYKDAGRRQVLANEYELLSSFARESIQPTYDLNDPVSRKAFKVRLLSYLRPTALKTLEDLGHLYQDRFQRRLAVTSLIRPDEYQRELHETNRNATLIDIPPHTTGLAFDVYYRYMTADEQTFVMTELARLRDEGKIEALRENNNHFHVFAFVDGHPPEEELIQSSLAEVPLRDTSPPKRHATVRGRRKR